MVYVNTRSVFSHLDLDDVASIKRVIVAMDYTLSNSVVNSRSEELENLRGEETAVTRTLQTMIRGQQLQSNDLILRATLRFVEARNGSDEDVLAAARRLEELAEASVFNMRVVHREEYSDAQDLFEEGQAADTYLRGYQTLFKRAPDAFGNQGDTARTGAHLEDFEQRINPTWFITTSTPPLIPAQASCSSVPATGKAPFTITRTKKRLRAVSKTGEIPAPAPKKPSMIVKLKIDWSKMKKPVLEPDETESELESDTPKPRATPEPQGKRPVKMRAEQGRLPEADDIPIPAGVDLARFSRGYRSTPPNRPVRFPGQMIIDDGAYDRESAEAGEMDTSKMILSFNLEKKNPLTGLIEPDGQALYKYRGDVMWDDKTSVSALQRWRTQNFGRALGPSQPAREIWLETERDLLLQILEQHLARVGGRWSRVSWKAVASTYNDQIRGTIQEAGELAAERMYTFSNTKKGKMYTNVSKGQSLSQDRTAPVRSALSCQNQLQVFTHKNVLKVINAAREADRQAGLKKAKGRKISLEPESTNARDSEDHGEEEVDQEAHGNQGGEDDQSLEGDDEQEDDQGNDLEADESYARRHAEFEAAEERRVTGPRAIAKDRAGRRWLKGG